MAVNIQVRRGTAAGWTAANPTLLAGEIGYETDTGKWKVGDGATVWTGLSYAGTAGPTGGSGPAGIGFPGLDGDEGEQGWPGPSGNVGATGATGSTGATGDTGPAGIGFPGLDGDDGDQGWPGPVGPAGSAASGPVTGYTPTIADCANTASITTICSFTIGANVMAVGDVVYVELPSLEKQNKGSAGTVTWTFSWNGTTVASSAIARGNRVAEGRVAYIFKLLRVGADIWVRGGGAAANDDFDLPFIDSNGSDYAYLITAPDFTTSQAVLIRATLSAADALFYIKPQTANVYRVAKQ